MLRVLARVAILMAVAPPTPVSWWPGARTLPDSVLGRLPRSATNAIERLEKARLRPSGARVIVIPVDGGRATPPRTAESQSLVPPPMAAPWGEPVSGFAGVTVSTCLVPREWLGPCARGRSFIQLSGTHTSAIPVTTGSSAARAGVSPPLATIRALPRQLRAWPPAPVVPGRMRSPSRIGRAAALVIGLLVSLVAVEAAARSGRR